MKDINTDRFYVVIGANMFFHLHDGRLLDSAPAVVTVAAQDPQAPENRPDRYPRCYRSAVQHELHVGTVAEHVEWYRRQLTAAYESLVVGSQTDDVIPTLGTPHTGPQQEALQRYGLTKHTVLPKANRKRFDDRATAFYRQYGPGLQLPAHASDLLQRLVCQWQFVSGQPNFPPVSVAAIDHLIDALRQLRQDRFLDEQPVEKEKATVDNG